MWDVSSLSTFGGMVGFDADSDVVVFLIAKYMDIEDMDSISYAQYEKACKALGTDDAESWK